MDLRLTVSVAAAFVLVGCHAMAQVERPILLPTPKKVEWPGGRVSLVPGSVVICQASSDRAVRCAARQINERIRSLGGTQARVASSAHELSGSTPVIWLGTRHELIELQGTLGVSLQLPGEACVPDGYVLRCEQVRGRNVVIIAGYDARGCYYGSQTLIQLVSSECGTISIPRVRITDWPTFRIRLVKTNGDADNPDNVARWADLLPRFKLNVLANQFHTSGDSLAWNKPGPTYLRNTHTVARAGKSNGTFDPALYLSVFGKNRGSLLDPQTISEYVRILGERISQGYRTVVVDLNDWGTYKHLTADEQARFKDIGEVMTWITNEAYTQLHPKYPDVRIMVVPAAGYYGGLPKPELISFCKSIPDDILVMTTGPVTRSKTITAEFLEDWASATGRKPFLWDNTLYSHLDEYRPLVNGFYNFNAFEVSFPPNMPDLLAGPGIHLNGGAIRWREPGVLTFLDYVWNPEAYDARTSLRNAQILLWGKDAPAAAEQAQQRASELFEYLYLAYSNKGQGTREEAAEKLEELKKAVRRLSDIIGDPATAQELETQCVGQAARTLTRVFR